MGVLEVRGAARTGASVGPVRGTQSFVGTMTDCIRHPSLVGLEVLWRWVFWSMVLAKPAHSLYAIVLQVVTAFQTGGFPGLGHVLAPFPESLRAWVFGHATLLPVMWLLWIVLAAAGRGAVLRRIDGRLKPSLPAMMVLAGLRWGLWAAVVALWCGGVGLAIRGFVSGPQSLGAEPNWVPFCAVVIAGTLVLFVLWLGSTWIFPLAEIYRAEGVSLGGSLRAACRRNVLGGKLAEINLVMGIVKIALLVLAMVFSACPLPFESVETQGFLLTWTAAVALLYFVASDYFHVVRAVAFVHMREVFGAAPAAAQGGKSASY